MKRLKYIFIAFFALILVSCKKGGTPTPDPSPAKFEITKLSSNTNKFVVGQVVELRAELSDNSGNIYYEWRLRFGTSTIEEQKGLDKNFKFHVEDKGEYEVEVVATRGDSDKYTHKEKIVFHEGDFQYGVWGDNEQTILDAELANGYKRFGSMVGVPLIVPNNEGLKYITFERGLTRFTYYFKDDKLVAGGHIFIYNNFSDGRPAYNNYGIGKSEIEGKLKITMPDQLIWTIGDESQKAYFLTNALTISDAIRAGYLSIKSEGESSTGFGRMHVYRTNYGLISEYVLGHKSALH